MSQEDKEMDVDELPPPVSAADEPVEASSVVSAPDEDGSTALANAVASTEDATDQSPPPAASPKSFPEDKEEVEQEATAEKETSVVEDAASPAPSQQPTAPADDDDDPSPATDQVVGEQATETVDPVVEKDSTVAEDGASQPPDGATVNGDTPLAEDDTAKDAEPQAESHIAASETEGLTADSRGDSEAPVEPVDQEVVEPSSSTTDASEDRNDETSKPEQSERASPDITPPSTNGTANGVLEDSSNEAHPVNGTAGLDTASESGPDKEAADVDVTMDDAADAEAVTDSIVSNSTEVQQTDVEMTTATTTAQNGDNREEQLATIDPSLLHFKPSESGTHADASGVVAATSSSSSMILGPQGQPLLGPALSEPTQDNEDKAALPNDEEVSDDEEEMKNATENGAEDDDDEEQDQLANSSEDDGPLAARANAQAGPSRSSTSRPRASGASSQRQSQSKPADIPLPHYDVIRDASPKGPHRIVFKPGVTDASASRWPSAQERTRGNTKAGALNYFEFLGKDEKLHLSWRKQLGNDLASLLNISTELAGGKTDEWILEEFPQDYGFFIHHSGKIGLAKPRTDYYVFGSTATAKFRTKAEMLPHLYWLLVNGPDQSLSCACKYCTKTTQGAVNAKIALSSNVKVRAASAALPDERPVKRAKHNGSPSAGQGSPQLSGPSDVKGKGKAKDQGAPGTKSAEKKKRVSDAAAKAKKAAEDLAAREPAYNGSYVDSTRDQDLNDGCKFRMGELLWVRLESPLVDPEDSTITLTHWPAVMIGREPVSSSEVVETGTTKTVKTTQSWKITARLLALEEKDVTGPEKRFSPWLETGPQDDVMSPEYFMDGTEGAIRAMNIAWTGQRVRKPKLSLLKDVREASFVYALSLQVAAHVVGSYSVLSRYTNNTSMYDHPTLLTAAEKQQLKAHQNSWHYQAVFWGAEKIWTGETVRIMPDQQLLDLHPPVGPGRSTDTARFFLRIDDISMEPEAAGSHCRVVGGLFELLDADHPKAQPRSPAEDKQAAVPPPPTPRHFFYSHGNKAIVVDLDYVAGRYYGPLPDRLSSPETIRKILHDDYKRNKLDGQYPENFSHLSADMRRLLLSGVAPSFRLHMQCGQFRPVRANALSKAESIAYEETRTFILSRDE